MPDAAKYRCLVCCRDFDELPWYGCCLSCYLSSAEVRAVVDDAHPLTPILPAFDPDMRIPDVDALLDREFGKAVA